MNTLKTNTKKLTTAAIKAMRFSYSPYSTKKIGASILLSNGKIYSGCNIENASYGGTVCAERVAIWKAYSENKSTIKIVELFVASDEACPWPPCGFCRQILSEFSGPETKITLLNLVGVKSEYQLNDIFPLAFQSEHLLKK